MAKTYYRNGKPYKHVDDNGKTTRVTSDPNSSSSKTSSGSSSKYKNIVVSLDSSGIETKIETSNGKTTTTITNTKTGQSVSKSGKTSYNNLTQTEKENINPSSKVDIEALRKKLQEEQKTKGLRAKVVDARTGRVVDQGNFKLNRDFERRLSSFERQYGELNPAQKINLATYEQLNGKVDPKSKDVRELLKIKSISPTLQQELQRQQTTSKELKEYVKQLNTPNAKSLSLVTEGEKRFVKGEQLVNFGGKTLVMQKNGKTRELTDKEKKELKENPDLVNPLRVFTGAFMGGAQLRTLVNQPDILVAGAKEFVKAPVTSTVNMLVSTGSQFSKDPFGFTGEMLAFEGVGGALAKGVKSVSKLAKTSKIGSKIGNTVKKIRIFEEDQLIKINSRINDLKQQGITVRGRSLESQELRLLSEQKVIFEKFKYYTSPIDNIKVNIAKKVKILEKTTSKSKRRKLANEITKDIKEANNLIEKRNKVKNSKQVKDHKKELAEFEKERLSQNKNSKVKIKEIKPLDEVKSVSEKRLIELLEENYKDGTLFKRLKKAIENKTGKKVLIRQKVTKGIKIKGSKVKTGSIGKVQIKLVDKKTFTQLTKKEKNKGKRINLKKEVKLDLTKKELREVEKKSQQIELDLLNGRVDKVVREVEKNQGIFKNKKGQAHLFRSTGKSFKKVDHVTKENINKVKKFIDDYRKKIEHVNKKNKEISQNKRKSKDFSKSEKERFTKEKKNLEKELKENIKQIKNFDKSLIKLTRIIPALVIVNKPIQASLSKQSILLKKAQDILQKQKLEFKKINPNKGKNKNTKPKDKNNKTTKGSSSTTKTSPKPDPKPRITPKLKVKTPNPKPKPKLKTQGKDNKKVKFNKVTTKGEIIYTNEKGNKIKIKTGLPYDWAYKVALETVDESLLGSTKVRKYGKIKSRNGLRFDNDLLKKFRDKKSKNPRVNEIVEKAKHRLDTKTEVSHIQVKKVLASKLKIAKETIKELKKVQKKAIKSSNSKKDKRSLKKSLKSNKKGGKR